MPAAAASQQDPSPPSRWRYWWLAGLAAAYSGLVYANALANPYAYDDMRTVQNNPSIENIYALKGIVLRESMRPLVNMTYALDRAIWPWELIGHHLTSILLHVVNVLLLFQLAWVATEDMRRRGASGPSERVSPVIVAFVSAALFGLHPMMTEAVGYISGRSEVLYGMFFLLALLAARRWMIGDGTRWAVLSVALWVAALLSKEVAVFWPVVASLYDHYVLASPTEAWRRRFRRLYLPLLLLTATAGAVRIGILVLIENPGEAHIMWQYVPVEIVVAFRYLRLIVAPTGQTIFHEVAAVKTPFDVRFLLALTWLVLWLAMAWRTRRRNAIVSLGMFWFVLLLAPSAILVLLDLGEPMAEHRVYMSAAGLFLAIGAGMGWAWAFFDTRSMRARLMLRFLLAAWLTVLGGLTVLRNAVWSSPVRLWLDAVEQSPEVWVPHLMLGEAFHDTGALNQALDEYRMAIKLRPTEQVPYMKLGLCLAEMRRLDEADGAFQKLEQIAPGSAVARNGRGAVAMIAGRYRDARGFYQSALAAHPTDVAARQSLALLAETVDHDPAAALKLCREVQQIAPETPGNDDCIRRNQEALNGAGPPR
jgi:tetratricopeptide (TPR) repeat protein